MRHGHLPTSIPAGPQARGPSPCHYSQLVKPDRTSEPDAAYKAMLVEIAEARRSGVDEPPADGRREIPAGYTYFGQLVVHDLTRSVANAASGQIANLNTPGLDLDTIYGGGPGRCPYFFQQPDKAGEQPCAFHTGRTGPALMAANQHLGYGVPFDLPRIDPDSRAISSSTSQRPVTPLVADPRNDDNLVLSQMTARFLLVHNRVVALLRQHEHLDAKARFSIARHFVLKSYRQIIVHDYLARMLLPATWRELVSGDLKAPAGLVSVEFALGVARIGHAMVRNRYIVNNHISAGASRLGVMMSFSGQAPDPILPLPADWVLDWRRFLEISDMKPQSARRISPFLPPTFVNGDIAVRATGLEGTLSFHDLWRCVQYRLASGQECARALLGHKSPDILSGERMLPTPEMMALHPAEDLYALLKKYPAFCDETPLSYYVQQEAWVLGEDGTRLGPLGSKIFALTMVSALRALPPDYPNDPGISLNSILKPSGITTLPEFMRVPELSDVALTELLMQTGSYPLSA